MHIYKYFLLHLDRLCEVQLVIDKLKTHDIERTNKTLKMVNEANSPKNNVMR